MTGAELIAAERQRQIEVEGYDADHDAGHADELAMAGAAYAEASVKPTDATWLSDVLLDFWPWDTADWKPSGDAKQDLIRAGALIAAAIDAL